MLVNEADANGDGVIDMPVSTHLIVLIIMHYKPCYVLKCSSSIRGVQELQSECIEQLCVALHSRSDLTDACFLRNRRSIHAYTGVHPCCLPVEAAKEHSGVYAYAILNSSSACIGQQL
jgi:hypothetical protein